MKLTEDDPRLTAFALGELEGAEAAQIAAVVANDPALQAVVDDVQRTMASLADALGAEPLPESAPFDLGAEAETAVDDVAPETTAGEEEPYPLSPRKVVRFPYWVSGLVAACLVAMVVLYDYGLNRHQPGEAAVVHYTTIDLRTPVAEKTEPAGASYATTASDQYVAPAAAEPAALAQREFSAQAVVAAEATTAERRAKDVPAFRVRNGTALAAGSIGSNPTFGLILSGSSAPRLAPPPQDLAVGEGYTEIDEQPWQRVSDHPLSTFAADVDTASYANVRRFLLNGALPPKDAVRIEEMLNAFNYDYAPPPAGTNTPLAAHIEVAAAPWAPDHRLVRIGLKGREMAINERPSASLVFLIDVSGSMQAENKLPLVKEAMRLLLSQLRSDDRVAIVTYAGAAGLALPSTPASDRRAVLAALDHLEAGGSTAGAMGIQLAYDIAKANFVPQGINRVILCTDGDFNVGVRGDGELGRLITEKARSGVALTALGFGMGNYQDHTLEKLADEGNGNYGYIDSAREARRLLVEQVNGTLATIAQDVKIQVEFNPAAVAAYRLIGYENRALAAEDFNNDRVDAGEVGAGHAVTALYEVVPTGATLPGDLGTAPAVDPLRYQTAANSETTAPRQATAAALTPELLTVKVRAKLPGETESRRWEFPIVDGGAAFAAASPDYKFASAVAGFGLTLRESSFLGSTTLARVVDWATQGLGNDATGYRREFVELVRRAEQIQADESAPAEGR